MPLEVTRHMMLRKFRLQPLPFQAGTSLVEVLVGIVLLAVVCISSLTYFAYGLGGIGKQGNRRAALERARERLEQILAAGGGGLPNFNGTSYWCQDGNPCTSWIASESPISQTVTVNDLEAQRMETKVKALDDPSAGTATLDVWEVGVKVWYTSETTDTDHHRVYLKTLRYPS